MKIAIIGTHGTGKTTLIQALSKEPEFQGFKMISSSTRGSVDYKLKINEDGDSLSQLYMACTDFKSLVENNALCSETNFISDRSLLDTLIYTFYLLKKDKVSLPVMESIDVLWENSKIMYDYLFWLRPEFPLKGDGVRSTEIKFQQEVDLLFKNYFFRENNLFPSVYQITGTVEERVEKIKKILWK